jgi:hypothetical protein|tara:strand:- start:180 stop:605 length:426 start_codon:yes stop_codon:yes gene_type:complete
MSEAERVGSSGEYLTASVLALYSDTVIIIPGSAQADIAFDVNGRLYKCQVKTRTEMWKRKKEYHRWSFDLRRGARTKDERRYSSQEIDIFACVALPLNKVFFLPNTNPPTQVLKTNKAMLETDSKQTLQDSLNTLNTAPTL